MTNSGRAAGSSKVIVDESIVSKAPMIIRRTVKFGETDAAGVVYTGRFLDYALEAFESWLANLLGLTWPQQNALGVGTPAVSCHLEFSRSLRAGDLLDIEVLLDRIGNGSFTVKTAGRNEAGEDVFESSLIFATIDPVERKPIRIPDRYRSLMTEYFEACTAAREK